MQQSIPITDGKQSLPYLKIRVQNPTWVISQLARWKIFCLTMERNSSQESRLKPNQTPSFLGYLEVFGKAISQITSGFEYSPYGIEKAGNDIPRADG
ncbi:MAG: hypothetical protein CFE49_01725 [Pseudomonas sp. PGPPP3]|nr:MAG: hypothetical protein CFE49_01725 [Pseudomonas sp. PGPPP3]